MLLSVAGFGQCTYNATDPFPVSMTISSGETLCVNGDYSTSNTTIAVQSGGVIRIYNNSKFTVNGSVSVYGTGKIYIEDCGSKLWVNGTYRGAYGYCEFNIFCDTCNDDNTGRFFKLTGGVEIWRDMCCVAPLPVEFTEFRIDQIDCLHKISWTTASEVNNSHFELQYSEDGIDWVTDTIIRGAGNSNISLTYTLTRKATLSLTYYRIKQVDYDGTTDYSDIEVAACAQLKKLMLIKTVNMLGQEINPDVRGWVFELYSDGTTRKIYR